METDPVTRFISQWRRERPDLDPSPLAVVSRLLMIYRYLEQSADQALSSHGLELWQFDVLAALRRSGAPFVLTPTQLSELITLSSGAMTNRIDRLEQLGLVVRRDDPEDRRGVRIALTSKGRQLVDEAAETRLKEARGDLEALTVEERKTLALLLERLLLDLRSRRENKNGRPADTHVRRKDQAPSGRRRSANARKRSIRQSLGSAQRG